MESPRSGRSPREERTLAHSSSSLAWRPSLINLHVTEHCGLLSKWSCYFCHIDHVNALWLLWIHKLTKGKIPKEMEDWSPDLALLKSKAGSRSMSELIRTTDWLKIGTGVWWAVGLRPDGKELPVMLETWLKIPGGGTQSQLGILAWESLGYICLTGYSP